MRVTSLGQAGLLVETAHGSDPVRSVVRAGVPRLRGSCSRATTGSTPDLLERIEQADYLYVSHLHGDHFDEVWLADHLPRDIPILVPGYPSRELDQRLRALGFTELVRTTSGDELDLGGLTVAIHTETSITDGPGGDSALVVSDGTSRLVDQNDCRTTDLDALAAHGPVDLHLLQYSGAIWYPMVYELDEASMRALVDAKVESQFSRAMRYVESVGARAVVPSAGPPCFLDPELFHLNVITGGEPSIFVDQRVFLERLVDGRSRRAAGDPRHRDRRRPRGDHRIATRPPTTTWRRSSSARASTCAPTRPTGSDGSTTCGRRGTASGAATSSPN